VEPLIAARANIRDTVRGKDLFTLWHDNIQGALGLDYVQYSQYLIDIVPANGVLVTDFDLTITNKHQFHNLSNTLPYNQTPTVDINHCTTTLRLTDEAQFGKIMGSTARQAALLQLIEGLAEKGVHIWIATFGLWPNACLAVMKQLCGKEWGKLQSFIYCTMTLQINLRAERNTKMTC
jgi:hypothetical protein